MTSLAKLFGVLVVGGSMLVSSGCSDDGDPDDGSKNATTPDATEVSDATQGSAADAHPNAPDAAPGQELLSCFCNTDACCVRDESDVGTLQDGFECCWGTTC